MEYEKPEDQQQQETIIEELGVTEKNNDNEKQNLECLNNNEATVMADDQPSLVAETKINENEPANSLVKYLTENKDECYQLIGEIIKIEQLDLNTVKEYLNQFDFNDFLKGCTKKKIFKSSKPLPTTTCSQEASTSSKTKRLSKRADSYTSDIDFIANINNSSVGDGDGDGEAPSVNTDNNNVLNQKKSLRLKKKNLLFKKLIEREKDDYYDNYSIDEDYEEMDTAEVVVPRAEEKIVKKINVKSSSELDTSSSSELKKGMINAVINGKNVIINENDYKQFVRCGKWCSLEFFRVVMSGRFFFLFIKALFLTNKSLFL